MARLRIHVEGITEKSFADVVLAPYLYSIGYTEVSARLIGHQTATARRGGIRSWEETRRSIVNHLRQDANLIVSTMVDYYGLPSQGTRRWPGRADAAALSFPERAAHIEDAIRSDVINLMGSGFNPIRFIPYVMMHEFEAMLFSDCARFAQAIDRPDLSDRFQQIKEGFNTPEEIDDSPETAPSKRIIDLLPSYQKPLDGTAAASTIGLAVIHRECPHFGQWLTRLENLIALATE